MWQWWWWRRKCGGGEDGDEEIKQIEMWQESENRKRYVVAEHGRQQKCVGGGFEEKKIEIKSR